jgi:hypothetical protein
VHGPVRHGDVVNMTDPGVNGTVDIFCHDGYWITDTAGYCGTYPCDANRLVRNGTETCFGNHSFWPHLRCDPWCEALEPPPHASVFPPERRRVGWNVTVQCDDRYYLTQDDELVTSGSPTLGDLTFGHLRTNGLEWYVLCLWCGISLYK